MPIYRIEWESTGVEEVEADNEGYALDRLNDELRDGNVWQIYKLFEPILISSQEDEEPND